MCWALSTGAGCRGEDREMAPDQGCYQERYRLTVPVARSAAVSFGVTDPRRLRRSAAALGDLGPCRLRPGHVPWLVAVASRKIAFRADSAGITLGADPLSWPFRHASAVFVPWSDAEAIALYRGGGPLGWRIGDELCLGIQRRADAPALSRGNKPARFWFLLHAQNLTSATCLSRRNPS
jgi:hypothetical protein